MITLRNGGPALDSPGLVVRKGKYSPNELDKEHTCAGCKQKIDFSKCTLET